MAIRNPSQQIKINGIPLPSPAPNFEIIRSTVVDSGRNANGTVVGQVIGRKLWKLNNLQWNGIDEDTVDSIINLLEDFYVKVTFVGTDNQVHTVTMYPSDITGQPVFFDKLKSQYHLYRTLKFNLIDCGIVGED